jgi:hypothetical protein
MWIAISVAQGRRERGKGRERWSEENKRRKRRLIEGYGENGGEEIRTWRGKEDRERQRGSIPMQLHTRVTAAAAHLL